MLFMLAVIPKQNRARNSSVMLEDASMRSRHKGYGLQAVVYKYISLIAFYGILYFIDNGKRASGVQR